MIYGLIHASGVATFGYALYYEFWQLHIPASIPRTETLIAMSKFPGKWKYLTVWNLVLQFAYHTYSLANDVAGSNEVDKKRQTIMQKIRDGFFASWIFPTGVFVTLSFWGLYAIDRELVFPKSLDAFYPNWLNHAVHTAPVIFLSLEMFNVPKIFPSRSNAVLGNLVFSSTYLGWITWVANYSGVWAYPILEVLNNGQRIAFLGASGGTLLGLYFVGEYIYRKRWAPSAVEEGKKKTNGSVTGKSKRKIK